MSIELWDKLFGTTLIVLLCMVVVSNSSKALKRLQCGVTGCIILVALLVLFRLWFGVTCVC